MSFLFINLLKKNIMININKDKGTKLVVCFSDKTKDKGPITLENPSKSVLKDLNEKGYGIFETANSFFATPGQLEELALKKGKISVTKRNKEFLTRLNEVFGDLDICKDSDNLPAEERDKRKNPLGSSNQENTFNKIKIN